MRLADDNAGGLKMAQGHAKKPDLPVEKISIFVAVTVMSSN
jgi:hypothetical protein